MRGIYMHIVTPLVYGSCVCGLFVSRKPAVLLVQADLSSLSLLVGFCSDWVADYTRVQTETQPALCCVVDIEVAPV